VALEEDTSFASRRVTRVLEAVIAGRGVPQAIRCDDGPELTSRHFLAWCIERKLARELVRNLLAAKDRCMANRIHRNERTAV
jgi:putative transposase